MPFPVLCCETLEHQVTERCDRHPDPVDCPDRILVWMSVGSGQWGFPVRDGGGSYVEARHCPWCGAELRSEPTVGELGLCGPDPGDDEARWTPDAAE